MACCLHFTLVALGLLTSFPPRIKISAHEPISGVSGSCSVHAMMIPQPSIKSEPALGALLGIGADPVDDAVLVKVVLVSEGEVLALTQLPHKDEGGAVEVVPLLRHLEHKHHGNSQMNSSARTTKRDSGLSGSVP